MQTLKYKNVNVTSILRFLLPSITLMDLSGNLLVGSKGHVCKLSLVDLYQFCLFPNVTIMKEAKNVTVGYIFVL